MEAWAMCAPVGSTTVPWMAPVAASWAEADIENNDTARAIENAARGIASPTSVRDEARRVVPQALPGAGGEVLRKSCGMRIPKERGQKPFLRNSGKPRFL